MTLRRCNVTMHWRHAIARYQRLEVVRHYAGMYLRSESCENQGRTLFQLSMSDLNWEGWVPKERVRGRWWVLKKWEHLFFTWARGVWWFSRPWSCWVRWWTLGARGGVLGWYISSPFRIFPTSFPAVFLGQEIAGTFTVFQIMWPGCPHQEHHGNIQNFLEVNWSQTLNLPAR